MPRASLLKQIKFSAPEEPNAVPAAMITGELDLSIKSDAVRAIVDRKFNILNDRLLNDTASKGTYYQMLKPVYFKDYPQGKN